MFISSNTSIAFYRDLADDYDDMTRFQKRMDQERSILITLQKKFKFKTALDVACGTGLHAILLQKIGVDTVGTDNSRAMLDKAHKNAMEAGIDVTWVQSDMRAVTKTINRTFDVIFCIGNSLPHIITTKQLLNAFREWHKLLNTDGRIIIQILNYTKILKDKERIVNITKQGPREYIRFYDFLSQKLQFNIIIINWEKQPPFQSLKSTILYPHERSSLSTVLHQAGFTNLKYFGNINLSPFSEEKSPNLVLIAQKSMEK